MKIKAIKPALNGRYSAILQNGEEVIISRKYVVELKRALKGEVVIMSTLMKADKSKTLTIIGMGIMTLLVFTKVVPTSQLAPYSLFVGLAFFFIVEAVSILALCSCFICCFCSSTSR